MKVCMIATRHTLDDARVVHKESRSLYDAGHDVSLILPCNEHFEYQRLDGSVVSVGKPPNGETNHNGLKVFGHPKKKGLYGKWKTFLEISRLAADIEADIYHAHEPDLALAIAIRAKNILLKKKKKVLVVHDMHEYPPGGPTDKAPSFLKPFLHFLIFLWNKISIQKTDHVFTANSIVRGYALFLKNNLDADVLYNGPSLKMFSQSFLNKWHDKSSKLMLCHEGSLPFNRGLKEMVEVVYQLKDHVSLKIIGDVYGNERKWLTKQIQKKNLSDKIIITGWLPYENVSQAIQDCHVGLILFRDCINNRMAGPPNKLFNYMSSGLPVLSVDFPEMRQIIFEEECGLLIQDQRVSSIVEAIEKLIYHPESIPIMGKNGQNAIKERYSWERIEKKLLSRYKILEKTLTNL